MPVIAWIALSLAGVVLSFVFENLWIDPWLRHKSHRIPTFVPVEQSGPWFLAFVIGAIVAMLMLTCLLLLVKDREAPVWTKLAIGFALGAVCFFGAEWFRVTNRQTSLFQLIHKRHKIVLRWKPSSSTVIGYNVYRRAGEDQNFAKLNSVPISDLTYTDNTVESGGTYEYLARAVDAGGTESGDSNPVILHVP